MELDASSALGAAAQRLRDDGRRRREHEAARAAVVRWQWAQPGSLLHETQPVERALGNCGRIRLLDREPTHDGERYGYDANGSLRFAELRGRASGPSSEVSIIDRPEGRSMWTRNAETDGWALTESLGGAVEEARIDIVESEPPVWATVRAYDTVAENVVSVRSVMARNWGDGWRFDPDVEFVARYEAEALSEVVRRDEARDTVIWSAERRNETHEKVLRRWRGALVRAVPSLIELSVKAGETVHAATFWFAPDAPFEAQLVVWLREPEKVALEQNEPTSRWSPAAAVSAAVAETIDLRRDAELDEIDAALRRTRRAHSEGEAATRERAILVQVSKSLNSVRTAWPLTSQRSPDFIAWPADYELDGLDQDLLRALPQRVRKRLS